MSRMAYVHQGGIRALSTFAKASVDHFVLARPPKPWRRRVARQIRSSVISVLNLSFAAEVTL
jgi:hypothetical protein